MGNIYLLNDECFEGIVNLPMIKIDFLRKEIDLDIYDSLIFTSKNAVKAIDGINKNWIKKDIYSIGKGTSQEIKKYQANLVFTSKTSYGNRFAEEIKDKLAKKKVLFVRAKKVISDLSSILRDHGVDLDEQIVYETLCRKYNIEDKPPFGSIIIFTSPSTVKCFFENFDWDESYKAVSIGEVTSTAIPSHIKSFIADEQTIQSCVDLAKHI